MKKMKRIVTMMLVLVLALALAAPVFAVETDGSITISNAVEGKTYNAYRLFDLTLDDMNKNYGYTINADWKDFFDTEGATYVKIDTTHDNVALKENITAAELQGLAQAAKIYAGKKPVAAVATEKATAPTLTFSNLPLGYYLVTTEVGALQALDTTNHNAVMYEKNTAPDIGKTADKTNAAYGETVHFTIPVTKGGYAWGDYVIKDTMTGLELKPDTVKVTVKSKPLVAKVDYTVASDTVSNPNTLTVTIQEATLNKRDAADTDFVYPAGTEFVLEYDAVAKATVSMENKVTMDYKTNPSVTTPDGNLPEHIVKVANYEFDVKKTNEKNEQLEGATFELHKKDDCTDDAMQFIKTGNTYRLAEADEAPAEGSELTSTITAGEAKIEGLAAGTYYLKEMAAPAGYNKLLKPVKVEIIEKLNENTGSTYYKQAFDDNGDRLNPTIKMNDAVVAADGASAFVLNIINKTGTELPSTGGIGTTVFYVVGGLMMAVAVVALITKKRMAQ